jgi:hypothetical protein
MADITIKKGDRLPVIARQFLTDGTATNLTGATVVFNMWNAATGTQVITNGTVTVTTAATGNVEYPWTANDANLDAGFYLASFAATFSSSRVLTAPNNGMITIQIVAATAAVWSYTGNPAARAIDKVRFLCGDTDSSNQQVMDDEINFLLSEWNSNAYLAAAFACDAISSKLAAKSDQSKSVGDLSISTQYGSQARTYMERAASLRSLASRVYAPSVNFDTSTFDGTFDFYVGMDENMGSSTTSPPTHNIIG